MSSSDESARQGKLLRCLPANIGFERWIHYVFDQPVLEPEWWWEKSKYHVRWTGESRSDRRLAYMTRLFSEPEILLPIYTHAQIDQGLNYLLSTACSEYMPTLVDKQLPWRDRRAGIESIISLYAKLMAPLYGNHLAHLDTKGTTVRDRPNFSCYMLWDICRPNSSSGSRFTQAVLRTFRETLKLRSEACLESALHGLGHWHEEVPEQTEPIVRAFLSNRQDISAELRRYAEAAAIGKVL